MGYKLRYGDIGADQDVVYNIFENHGTNSPKAAAFVVQITWKLRKNQASAS